ncbi:MAG: hypothetical protein YK1309IOTA_1470010 [Marine Group I thaumarchaeote]|nr:MAG: hypothetical protein YK1309IOTA_1470010 [Marine Group I thaumarchaeote]
MSETPSIINTIFVGLIFLIIGFFLGQIQIKNIITNVGHTFSEKILEALKISERGEIQQTVYSRAKGDFVFERPQATTAGS